MKFWLVRLASVAVAIGFCLLVDGFSHARTGEYQQRLVELAALYVTLAVSLNLINGITGQFSIGHAAFYQIGAYTTGWLSRYYMRDLGHTPQPTLWLLLMMLMGAALAAVAGFAVGLPSLRLRGDYLAIVTLGFGEIVRFIVQNTDAVGGATALDNIPKIQPIWLAVLLAITCIAVSRNLIRTARGLTFLGVREDEVASQAMGVNITQTKVTAFVLGAAFAGAAGVLLSHYEGVVTPQTFNMDTSFIILTMVVLGGTGSITGSVVCALFLFYLPEYLRNLETPSGQSITLSGAFIVGALVATGLGLASMKRLMISHWSTPTTRGFTYVGIAIVGVILARILGAGLEVVKPLHEMQIGTDRLRMVIFAVSLIGVMLLRPQGIFAHHEFSWSWVAKLFGKRPQNAEVAA